MPGHSDQSCPGCRALELRLSRVERALFGDSKGDARANPAARTVGDMITPRQLGNIRRKAADARVDADAECRRFYGLETGDLSTNAADAFLKHLQVLARRVAHDGGRG
jgi:hypothetical protein